MTFGGAASASRQTSRAAKKAHANRHGIRIDMLSSALLDSVMRRRMGSGGSRGLQNRCFGAEASKGWFDSDTPPPRDDDLEGRRFHDLPRRPFRTVPESSPACVAECIRRALPSRPFSLFAGRRPDELLNQFVKP